MRYKFNTKGSGGDVVGRKLLAVEGFIDLGMYEEAERELNELDPAYLAFEETLVMQLCVFAGLQKWKEARDLAISLADQDPNNAQWTIWSASAACRLQSVEAAKKILVQALDSHPDNANIHYNLSCYETRLRHFHKAQRHLLRAIQLDPRFRLLAMDDADLQPLFAEVAAARAED
ncbi:MAG TPA: hypothetical protein VJ719_11935 [Chthoniobacterales bacterium]|nr:hypothetical protein [Chthoniobacterales bacterium]